jgi:hypothetical protein
MLCAGLSQQTGLRFCISEGAVIQCQEDVSQGLARWKLAIIITIPACLIFGFLVILACHTCRLRQRLKELQVVPGPLHSTCASPFFSVCHFKSLSFEIL